MTNRIFCLFDELGFPESYWQTDACSSLNVIPERAVELSQSEFNDLFDHPGERKWVGGKVVNFVPTPPVIVPDRVSRRQFRLQLIDVGLLSTVEDWIASQDQRTQAAYADSGTFLRSDEMLQQGFAALGFTTKQVDDFFVAAAAL